MSAYAIPAHINIAIIQVGQNPIAPPALLIALPLERLPPMTAKFLSMGAIVWPCWILKIRPRQMNQPPRVTMNEGIPT